MREAAIGSGIVLDWHDGPLLEIFLVTFISGSDYDKLVQVEALCVGGSRGTIRLSRANLQAALDLLDGNPVTDFYGAVIVCPACSTAGGCAAHQRFTCASCGKLEPWSNGADDDRPMDCSTCWLKIHGNVAEGGAK